VDADSDRSLGLGQDRQEQGEATETNLTQRLISTLEPIVGQDKIRASVNVSYDQASTEENEEKYDPTVSAVLSEQKTEDRAGGAAGISGGVPGAASNIPSKQSQAKPQDASTAQNVQTSTTQSAQYGVNKTDTHTVMPAGRIQRVTAAILLDDAVVRSVAGGKESFKKVKRSQEELDKIQQLAEGVIGFDAKRGDTISVQDLSFDSVVSAADMPVLNWNEKAQKAVTGYSSLLRPVSLLMLFLLAYLFVLRPIQKHALGAGKPYQMTQPALESGPTANHPAGGISGGINDTRGAMQLKDQTIELIRQKPANTARAVQAWLREEPS